MGLPLNILLVEDDPDDYLLIKETLEDIETYRVQLVWETSHRSGLQRLQDEDFDICLVDYKIGAQTGIDFISEALSRHSETPFILITGVADQEIDLKASDAGAADFFEKAAMTSVSLERAIRYSIARVGMNSLRQSHAKNARSILEHELRRAVNERQFEIYLQPEIHCESLTVRKAEALVRWNHPTRGTLGPYQFIDVAEDTGLINDIGKCVIDQVCRLGNRLKVSGHDLRIAFNVSIAQIECHDFADMVSRTIAANKTDPSTIELELTESVAMREPRMVRNHIEALKKIGMRFAVDDFGTGHSGLATLKDFPFDIIKIDRSFVQTAEQNPRTRAIAKTIFYLADVMRLETVAEGVETDTQFAFVRNYGATFAQGFLFSAPLSVREFESFLQTFRFDRAAPELRLASHM